MPGRRLPEPFSVRNFRSYVKDSLSYLGEQVIVLSMFHVVTDEKTAPRCQCYDDDYQDISNWKCPYCYGTSFAGGVKKAVRAWAQITDTTSTEESTERGYFNADRREIQLEWYPILIQGDYVVRVPKDRWIDDQTPGAVLGVYRVGEVQSGSLRQGQYEGQNPSDLFGQRASLQRIDEDGSSIYQFPIVGQHFPREDGRKI